MHYNRDLSWLGFNHRVLKEAACETVPLMERIRFLSIFSSNLDEFFRVRYPAIIAISQLNAKTRKKIHGDEDFLLKIQNEVNDQLAEFGHLLEGEILPELDKAGIVLYYNSTIQDEHRTEIKEIFLSKVLSFIQPIFLTAEAERKFIPENGLLYFIVTLKRPNAEDLQHGIINIPSENLPRFFKLSQVDGKEYIIFLDDIIRQNVHFVFPGYDIKSIFSIKFNRDAELNLHDEFGGNLLKKIEKQLKARELGEPSRFLYEPGMPKNLQLFLAGLFDIQQEESFEGGPYHNLKDLADLPVENAIPAYEQWKPVTAKIFKGDGDIFKVMAKKDVLLHLPYHSYNTILTFFNQAAIDPFVTEIHITLYRVAAASHIVNALISAAKNGKKVTAFIELKARFDEAQNIQWSKKMKEAGVRIIYSIPLIKVHSKIGLVKRESGDNSMLYAVLSTGNFNEQTARFYTDHALLTTRDEITGELQQLFDFLKDRENPVYNSKLRFDTLYVSQFNLIERFEDLINKEIKKVKKGKPGSIRIKVNNLEEPYMIDLLYKAAKAGVNVQLIVRSICCLVPQVSNLSENIIVQRIVDRYLEHTRLFIFGEDEKAMVILGSADLMTRNLRRRIEVCAPILDDACKKELIHYFQLQWNDNDKAVRLTSEMKQISIDIGSNEVRNAQLSIYEFLKNKNEDF